MNLSAIYRSVYASLIPCALLLSEGMALGQPLPPQRWKQGDMWQIDAEWFPVGNAKADNKAKPKFDLLASVFKGATLAGKDCWQLALIPDGDPVGTEYELVIIAAGAEVKAGKFVVVK